jgi:hypothetical protein
MGANHEEDLVKKSCGYSVRVGDWPYFEFSRSFLISFLGGLCLARSRYRWIPLFEVLKGRPIPRWPWSSQLSYLPTLKPQTLLSYQRTETPLIKARGA